MTIKSSLSATALQGKMTCPSLLIKQKRMRQVFFFVRSFELCFCCVGLREMGSARHRPFDPNFKPASPLGQGNKPHGSSIWSEVVRVFGAVSRRRSSVGGKGLWLRALVGGPPSSDKTLGGAAPKGMPTFRGRTE